MKEQSINPQVPVQLPSSTSSYKKYLSHFQSINKPLKIPLTFMANGSRDPNSGGQYKGNSLEMYASSISIIDRIADSPVKAQLGHDGENEAELTDFIVTPMIVNLNPRIKEKVVAINSFFTDTKKQYYVQQNYLQGTLNSYIHNILAIDMSNTLPISQFQDSHIKSRSRSRQLVSPKPSVVHPSPPKIVPIQSQPAKIVPSSSHIDTQKFHPSPPVGSSPSPPSAISNQTPKLKKMDLLFVQILKQKKRRGLVSDYYRAIEMKLVEMLQYILQDQPEYFGLQLKDKLREVLKNLQKFKGKTIDGQSKVNLLRLFFEEYRNLKRQRQQETKRENRSRSHSKNTISKNEQKNSVVNQSMHLRNKKSFDTMSAGGSKHQDRNKQKNPLKNVSTKSVKQQDQWIGSLDN